MSVPKSPIMPKNSTRLRFFTVYSWQTLDTAYRAALTSTSPSPNNTWLPAVTETHTKTKTQISTNFVQDEDISSNKNHSLWYILHVASLIILFLYNLIFCNRSKIPTEFGKRFMRRKTKISIKHNQGVMKLCPFLPPIIKYLLEPWSLPASRSAPTIAPTPSKHTATAIKCNGL